MAEHKVTIKVDGSRPGTSVVKTLGDSISRWSFGHFSNDVLSRLLGINADGIYEITVVKKPTARILMWKRGEDKFNLVCEGCGNNIVDYNILTQENPCCRYCGSLLIVEPVLASDVIRPIGETL
jgi:hypothetical protein